MLTILGGLAEFERELIRARTWRRQEAGKGPWREVWTATGSSRPINGRKPYTALGRRDVSADLGRSLWRRPHDHRTAAGVMSQLDVTGYLPVMSPRKSNSVSLTLRRAIIVAGHYCPLAAHVGHRSTWAFSVNNQIQRQFNLAARERAIR